MEKNTLQFNLINNKEFDSNDYTEKQKQAELLCRTVVHLKALRTYPTFEALPFAIHQESLETLGHAFVERNFDQPVQLTPSIQTNEHLAIQSS